MKRKCMRNDLLLMLGVLLIAGIAYLVFHAFSPTGAWAVIEQEGKVMARLSLQETQQYPLENVFGRNVVCIENGSVWMESADCPDGLCVKEGKISSTSQRIVCLPHRLVIRIEGEKVQLDDMVK